MSILTAEGLSVSLGGRHVLSDVDIALRAGEMIGLLGPNGAGKTTLVRLLAGMQRPEAGSVELFGRNLARYRSEEIARRLAYLPQGGECHWPMRVEEVIALGRLPHRAPWGSLSAADTEAIASAMRAADVAHLSGRPMNTLSGGERARVLLARALAVESEILLADEPVAGLDPLHQLNVMEVLQRKARDGAAVIAVLHDLTLASRFFDRLVLLSHGRVIADDVPRNVLTPGHLAHGYGIRAHYGQTERGLLVVPLGRAD